MAPAEPARAPVERLYVRLDGDPLYTPETSVPAGTLREFAVPRGLHDLVAHVVAHEERLAEREQVRERVVPDGSLHLVFAPGEARAPLRVAGPTLRPAMLVMQGHVQALSVKLKPGAALALFGTSAHEIAGRALSWDELVPPSARSLPERLQETRTNEQRIDVMARVLRSMLAETDAAALQNVRAVRALLRGPAPLAIPAAAASVGLSERRLQQLFQAHVGLSPRAWRRLARIHDCLRLLRRGRAMSWAAVAAECGFADQSHLSHEFRAICGLSPMQFLERKADDGPTGP